jgi:hypothetical protein
MGLKPDTGLHLFPISNPPIIIGIKTSNRTSLKKSHTKNSPQLPNTHTDHRTITNISTNVFMQVDAWGKSINAATKWSVSLLLDFIIISNYKLQS